MKEYFQGDFRLGIIAGGQLGKMLASAAAPWGLKTWILDPASDCPAALSGSHVVAGNFKNYQDVYDFGKQVDFITYEIESINTEALKQLKAEGKTVRPDPETLELIQDKQLQKEFFQKHAFPSAPFQVFESHQEILDQINAGTLSYPFVQKLCKGGYDGRGVSVLHGPDELSELLHGRSLVETCIPIAREFSVIVARNPSGQVLSYPATDMHILAEANMLEYLSSPSRLGTKVLEQAARISQHIAEALRYEGLLAVELFLDEMGAVWVNEISPRPHNSGHHTIESATTSQYEQHLRAVLDLPLGNTSLRAPSVMFNLIGEPQADGKPEYLGLREALATEGVHVHIYGKKQVRPYRKMGHVTVVAASLEDAENKMHAIKPLMKVVS